ncbi:hypothetical protein NQZ68_016599 [Dissostichus eleginoides]|uniref:Transmembrane protein 100 n=1 Tax=Dissostichus eleginoides TaxID=100907 RepID=A0AAD9BJK1_DISEL|nr:hypothetical protein NQZ68_016599 [Dissostichus eleginoides]KAK1883854.1 Transmembrane protein 100 [Dissostichus eleginoides]
MLVLNLVFLALLASSTAQSVIPQYIQSQWVIPDDGPQYEDTYERYLPEKESVWPQYPPRAVELGTVEDLNVPTTPDPYAMKEDGSGEEELAVWKIVLVVSVLLVSVVGSLSMSYYMCFWRGGRIHYQPQKGNHA